MSGEQYEGSSQNTHEILHWVVGKLHDEQDGYECILLLANYDILSHNRSFTSSVNTFPLI
jgi:hypothetical protein